MTPPTENLVQAALHTLKETHESAEQAWEDENRSHFWGAEPSRLSTTSTVESFWTGTGESLFRNALLPGLESAEREVILATCFWAKSASRDLLAQSLRRLSEKALARGDGLTIRVFIGLSSRSLWQKLTHTSDPNGCTYPPSTWAAQLGLPPPAELRGLDVTIKSRFFRPFSVMHPKFLIVDRRKLWMPSCNVSWESWYEGCVVLHGPVVQTALDVWSAFWQMPARRAEASGSAAGDETAGGEGEHDPLQQDGRGTGHRVLAKKVSMTLLPSQHHASLLLSFPAWYLSDQKPPLTPLNVVLMHLFTKARRSIALNTPNLTCPPVVDALLAALGRGIDVTITTNRRMMIVEQLFTSFTITEFWVWKLIRAYQKLQSRNFSSGNPSHGTHYSRLLEEGRAPSALGQLEIHYFCPSTSQSDSSETGSPVKSHVKCTIVDDSTVVLGSGNQDRASWFTSQELGIVICDPWVARQVGWLIKHGLNGKTRQAFPAMAR